MTSVLRSLQLLGMVVWVGGIVFFAFVLAPVAFRTLPTIREAGLVVGESLRLFDWFGLIAGAVFLGSTGLLFGRASRPAEGRGVGGRRSRYEAEFLLACAMLAATAYIHWKLLPSMDADRARAGGDIALLSPTDATRVHFDTLHKRSERTEGAVLLLGLVVVVLLAAEPAGAD